MYIEFGYDPDEYLENLHFNTEWKSKILAPIGSKFQDVYGQPEVQLIIDENAINSILYEFVLMDKFFSLRKLFKADQSLYEKYGDYLKTDLLKDILPDMFKQYGSKPCDIVVTMSHNFIQQHWPGKKGTGVTFT